MLDGSQAAIFGLQALNGFIQTVNLGYVVMELRLNFAHEVLLIANVLEQVMADVIANDASGGRSSECCIQVYRIKRSGILLIRWVISEVD